MTFSFPPKAVIFDMDGLLFDTEALYQKAIQITADEGGHDISPVIHDMIGRPWEKSKILLLDHYGPSFPADEFMKKMVQHFKIMAPTDLKIKPGAVEMLDLLDELKVPRAIATSSAHHTVQGHLEAHNMVGRFNKIIAHGDYILSKPAPDPFLKAAEILEVAPEQCLALEDSYNGVRSAVAAGMITVMVPDLHAPTDEMRSICAFIANDLNMVKNEIVKIYK